MSDHYENEIEGEIICSFVSKESCDKLKDALERKRRAHFEAIAHNTELDDTIDKLRDGHKNIMNIACQESRKLKAENKKLREALSFYAYEKNWTCYSRDFETGENLVMANDNEEGNIHGGKRARQCLKELGGEL